MQYRIDVVCGPTATPVAGYTTSETEDKTTTIDEGLDDFSIAQEHAITAYGHATALGLPVNGTYVVRTDSDPMKVAGEFTPAGWKSFE